MIRPKKQTVAIGSVTGRMIADHLNDIRHLIIGSEKSIDGSAFRNLYFEPQFVIMTETV